VLVQICSGTVLSLLRTSGNTEYVDWEISVGWVKRRVNQELQSLEPDLLWSGQPIGITMR